MTTWPEHLGPRFGTERPRKLLALDGGGIRGVLTLEILAEMERQIAAQTGLARLGDYFDYIGGRQLKATEGGRTTFLQFDERPEPSGVCVRGQSVNCVTGSPEFTR